MNTSLLSRAPAAFLVLALILAVLLPGPALAQSSASASASASPSPGTAQYTQNAATADVGDAPGAFSENVTDGTEEVNETLTSGSVPSARASVPPDSAAENLTVLPDTGGAPLAALGAGLLLVAGGVCARRMLR